MHGHAFPVEPQSCVRRRFDPPALADGGPGLTALPSVLAVASNLACMAAKRRQPGTVAPRLSSRHLGWYPSPSFNLGKRANK